MPEQDHGLMQGFQLWVNLPAKDKMTAPRYQDIAPEKIPVARLGAGARAKVLAGEIAGVKGPVDPGATDPLFLDVALEPNAETAFDLKPAHNAFVYVHEGEAATGEGNDAVVLVKGRVGVLSQGSKLSLKGGKSGAKLILVAGKPLREPVAKYGPFVMNTEAELRQAFLDYQAGKF
jgi:redox-sensitive bicupin YhaK (pirin superfamily)